MKSKRLWVIGAAFSLLLAGSGYWYVAIAGAPQLDGPQAQGNTTLSYQMVSYNSQAMGGVRTYGVSLPPDYAAHPEQRYPVIFLLHGGHGSPTDWFKKAAALSIIQQLYAAGKLPPSIIITPDGNDQRGSSAFFDPQYIDGKNGKVATAIGEELVKVVRSRYRTLPAPDFWAIGGLSSGGWGAMNIGLHHPNNFSVLFSHSGYFRDASGANNSPVIYIYKLPEQTLIRLRIYIDAGKEEERFLKESQQFHKVLEQLNVSHVFNEFAGGHGLMGSDSGWNYWHRHLADSLSYVGEQFQQDQQAKAPAAPARQSAARATGIGSGALGIGN
ncbi:MAG: alpha/beta hydrolase-fold protein [Oscillatoria sp. Prado101]|nr:alpha/beta hydrolase-fold protein [Oscillatoria sp. Prado101]